MFPLACELFHVLSLCYFPFSVRKNTSKCLRSVHSWALQIMGLQKGRKILFSFLCFRFTMNSGELLGIFQLILLRDMKNYFTGSASSQLKCYFPSISFCTSLPSLLDNPTTCHGRKAICRICHFKNSNHSICWCLPGTLYNFFVLCTTRRHKLTWSTQWHESRKFVYNRTANRKTFL